MTLQKYQAKRHFDKTPEPVGKPKRSARGARFVVQQHQASTLHFDFRLEMDGVLKSWAVPKGPSLNPADKRLAIEVEDHPLDYRTFEGTIPSGNYGAGTVMVWDEGTYEPVEALAKKNQDQHLHEEWERGRLRFFLHGTKLQGEFSLIRLKGQDKNWLLIKHHDASASEKDVLKQNRSVLTRRSMAEIAGAAPTKGNVWHSKQRSASRRPVNPGTQTPARIKKTSRPGTQKHHQPMMATLTAEPFDRKNWWFEIKWDGYRAIAEVDGGKVRLYSRKQTSFENKFHPLLQSLAKLGHDAVLDGEVVVLDEQGKSQFQLLQNYQRTGQGNLVYYVFDLLFLDGKDLREMPLRRRKELLAAILPTDSNMRLSDHVEEKGRSFFEAALTQGLEGIIAKNTTSPYREGIRGMDWLKIKARQQQEAVICGFTKPRGTRRDLGALVLGLYEEDELVYIGHTGGGFDASGLARMRALLDPLVQAKCPFLKRPRTNAPVQWVRPELVCQVVFQEWTEDGMMRQPIFLGMREDKPARAVQREQPVPTPDSPMQAQRVADPTPKSRRRSEHSSRNTGSPTQEDLPDGNFTHLNKVYWPKEGYTKGDLLHYYHALAPFLLPYLRDRPLSLLRHPNGILGNHFFQKDMAGQQLPEFVQTASIASETRAGEIQYAVCQNEETLLYLANLGCIELNPWHSRLHALDRPDYLIMDLDPQDVPLAEAVPVAQAIRQLLEKGNAACYCKTSGKRGLHVYIPLGGHYDEDQVRRFAEILARYIHEQLPESTSVVRSPALRRHRVYLDYLQNRHGQTIVAPYSVRPTEGALVSTPLRWREVNRKLDPTRFTIWTLKRRLDLHGDLWQPVLGESIDLAKCLDHMR